MLVKALTTFGRRIDNGVANGFFPLNTLVELGDVRSAGTMVQHSYRRRTFPTQEPTHFKGWAESQLSAP